MNTTFTYNEKYLMKNEQAWFPIMGEFHYSRFNKNEWKESLYKMKANGIDVVSTYSFWIHHEEVRGEYEFEGNLDLREFVEAIKEVGLYLFLRIGPWCHGEVRNGGFPDWLLQLPFEARTNDPLYFEEVDKFYRQIYSQVEGLFHDQGGPIIGIQIENEYGHCGGLTGEAGEEHMRTLTSMAKDIGFITPYYTATGWGGAVTGGLVPVMGGYCDAPWDQRITAIEPSGNFIFTHERNDHNIGSDYGFGEGITFDIDKFPYLTAELGGGLQVTHHRRPIATGKDISAMSLAKLGSGVNLLGYYMYHGGTNPKGKLTSLQETKETSFLNDYQVFNYDFQGAIRQYGQVSETARELKLWAYFVKDFGQEFCELPAVIPADNPLYPTDHTQLRYSYRRNKTSGYVFVNNYQKGQQMHDHQQVVLEAKCEDESLRFAPIDVKNEDFFFFPFNMDLGSARLKTALASPLCKLNNSLATYVFYTDVEPNYVLDGELKDAEILTISREDALNTWKIKLDDEHICISEALILQENDGVKVIARDSMTFKCYPKLPQTPDGFVQLDDDEKFSVYSRVMVQESKVSFKLKDEVKDVKSYTITMDYEEQHDTFVRLHYIGDQGKVYVQNEFVADHFYLGETWELSLKALGYPKELTLVVEPLYQDAKVYMEVFPEFTDGKACELLDVKLEAEVKYHLL